MNFSNGGVFAGSGGGSSKLKLPDDETYGGTEAIAGIKEGDKHENAFDKIETVLGKLAPAKPPRLSECNFIIPNTYSANKVGTGERVDNIRNDDAFSATLNQEFFDGANGELVAQIDDADVGSRTLYEASDAGIYGQLAITKDEDKYLGQFGSEGFWYQLTAQVNVPSLAEGEHSVAMTHSTTGNTTKNFTTEKELPRSISAHSAVASPTQYRYISGVPSLIAGEPIEVGYTLEGLVNWHYNRGTIVRHSGPCINAFNLPAPAAPYNYKAIISSTDTVTVANGVYAEFVRVTTAGYSYSGKVVSGVLDADYRVDTKSDESNRRQVSDNSSYYPTGEITTFDSTRDVALVADLQCLGGVYQMPSGKYVNDTIDYDTIIAFPHRWAMFDLGTISNVTSVTLNINGAVNFTDIGTPDLRIQLKVVDGDNTGWLECNEAYPGVGNPTDNGDSAMVYDSSSSNSRKVTFGTQTRSGRVYVRIGFNDSKKFTSISKA